MAHLKINKAKGRMAYCYLQLLILFEFYNFLTSFSTF